MNSIERYDFNFVTDHTHTNTHTHTYTHTHQGQNHITALSRAVYFIVVGTLALIINAALENLEFAPLCLYGLDINNRDVLATVRDALLSEWVWTDGHVTS